MKIKKIALICTGSTCTSKNEVETTEQYFRDHNLETVYQQDTYHYLPARTRADILLSYLQNEAIDLIWALRGGEGTADIIPYIEAHAHQIRQFTPKLLFGFSDFTPLLVYFQQRFAWPVVHGPAARQLSHLELAQTTVQQIFAWLKGKESVVINNIQPLNEAGQVPATISAKITGGNLSLVHISLNDLWQVDGRNKILLLEEVNERAYRVSRNLKHLQRINFFAGCKAILFAGCNFPAQSEKITQPMEQILSEFALQHSFPVLYTEKVGHGQQNLPLPYHLPVSLTLGSQTQLTAPYHGQNC